MPVACAAPVPFLGRMRLFAVTRTQLFAFEGDSQKIVAIDIRTGSQESSWGCGPLEHLKCMAGAAAISLERDEIYYTTDGIILTVYCFKEPSV